MTSNTVQKLSTKVQPLNDSWDEVVALISKKNWNGAILALEALGFEGRAGIEGRSLHVLALREAGRLQEAETCARSHLDALPNDPRLWIEIALIEFAQRNWGAARRKFALIRERFPEIPDGYWRGAQVARELRDWADAGSMLVVATARFPCNLEIQEQLQSYPLRTDLASIGKSTTSGVELSLEPRRMGEYLHARNSLTKTIEVLPASAIHFQRRPPALLHDPHQTGWGKELLSPKLIRRAHVLCHYVPEARHIGHRLVVDPNGRIALDEVFDDAAACEVQLSRFADRSDVLRREDTDVERRSQAYYSTRLGNEAEEISGKTFSLLSVEPSNYGSWLFRVIPKLATALKLGIKDYKIACWCPSPFQRQLLDFFGVKPSQIVDISMAKTYHYEELFVPTNPNPEAYLNEMTCDFVKKTLLRHNIRRSRTRCFYVSRVSHARRKGFNNVRHFLDEEKLVTILERAGFEIVEPESMSVFEQVQLFASAAMVVGASGAAMFNTIFCEPGTVVFDIEAFPYWLHAHTNYFSSCGHIYALALGIANKADLSGPHQEWTIDVKSTSDQIIKLKDLLATH